MKIMWILIARKCQNCNNPDMIFQMVSTKMLQLTTPFYHICIFDESIYTTTDIKHIMSFYVRY